MYSVLYMMFFWWWWLGRVVASGTACSYQFLLMRTTREDGERVLFSSGADEEIPQSREGRLRGGLDRHIRQSDTRIPSTRDYRPLHHSNDVLLFIQRYTDSLSLVLLLLLLFFLNRLVGLPKVWTRIIWNLINGWIISPGRRIYRRWSP